MSQSIKLPRWKQPNLQQSPGRQLPYLMISPASPGEVRFQPLLPPNRWSLLLTPELEITRNHGAKAQKTVRQKKWLMSKSFTKYWKIYVYYYYARAKSPGQLVAALGVQTRETLESSARPELTRSGETHLKDSTQWVPDAGFHAFAARALTSGYRLFSLAPNETRDKN